MRFSTPLSHCLLFFKKYVNPECATQLAVCVIPIVILGMPVIYISTVYLSGIEKFLFQKSFSNVEYQDWFEMHIPGYFKNVGSIFGHPNQFIITRIHLGTTMVLLNHLIVFHLSLFLNQIMLMKGFRYLYCGLLG